MCIPHETISFHWITKVFHMQETVLRGTEGSCENWGGGGESTNQNLCSALRKERKKHQLNMTRLPQGICIYLRVLKDKVVEMTRMEAQQLTPSWHSLVFPKLSLWDPQGEKQKGDRRLGKGEQRLSMKAWTKTCSAFLANIQMQSTIKLLEVRASHPVMGLSDQIRGQYVHCMPL